ncbi:MAG: hypothetical protein ACOCU4_00435 [Alkalispirochaeta sp.]
MKHRVSPSLIAGILMLAAAGSAAAQEIPRGWQPSNPFLEEEAPPAVFDLDRGDAEVDLYLLGSWTAQSRVATGIAFHPALPDSGRRVTAPYDYPGFETELFAQTVDLTLSLWLYRNYFFEASFSDESNVNTIAAGYVGDEEELVQEVVVGNVPLTVERYPYQYTGSPGARAGRDPMPGAVMRLQTARTYHEFLLQLESSQARRIRLAAGGILTEARIPAHRYLRETRYVLPDGDISAVSVYVEDPEGSILTDGESRRFRELDESAGEYTIDRAAGTLRISSELRESGRPVAVYYETAAGVPVGSSAGGAGGGALIPLDETSLAPTEGSLLDFSFEGAAEDDSLYGLLTGGAITTGPTLGDYALPLADGRSALLLRQSGLWSPFEVANLYALPEDLPLPEEDSLRVQLVHPGTRTPIEDEREFRVRRVGSSRLVEVIPTESAGGAETVRDATWRYPFAVRAPREAHAGIYGPAATAGGAPVELLVSYRTDEEEVALDGDVVPGTVRVTVDGRPLEGAEFDPASGSLTLPDSVPPTSVVDVSYREYTSATGGDVVAVSGNRWEVSPNLSVALAAGLRWTLTDDSFSTEMDQHPGRATLSTGVAYQGEELTVDAAAAVQISRSDTTGFMRLAGATGRSTTITPDAETTFPASAPDSAGGPLGAWDPDLRAEARYRDYWSVDAVGNVSLLPYDRTPAADESRSGARVGPYLARATDSAYAGPVAVLEWDELSPEQWVGAHIRVSGGETDLRTARSVTVRYRVLPPAGSDSGDAAAQPAGGTPELRLDLGALDEDLDGDGTLDEGRSAVDPLLEFDAPRGLRRAGQDAPRLAAAHSEDGNANGVLDGEAPGGVFSALLEQSGSGNPLTDTGWQTVTIPLDGTDRSRLSATRAARVSLRNTSTTDAVSGGRVLIGSVEVTRTSDAVVIARGGGTADVAETTDPLTGADALRRRFPVVGDRLASDAGSQRVFALEWENATAAATGSDPAVEDPGVALETSIPEFSPDRYRTLVLFMYLEDASGSPEETVEVRLVPYANAPDDAGIIVTLPAAELTGRWHEVAVSLADGTVRIDDDTTDLPADLPDESTYLRTLQVKARGLSAGTLYVDELHATDPVAGLSAAGDVGAVWQRTISEGRLADTRVTVEQRVSAQGEEFRAGSTGTTTAAGGGTPVGNALRSTSLIRGERDLVLTEVQTTVETDGEGGSGAFGHRLHAPLLPAGVLRLRERFYRDYAPRGAVADRALEFISAGDWGSWRLTTTNRADQREILQQWGISAAPPALGPVGVSITADASVRSLDEAVDADPYGASWLASNARVLPIPQKQGRQERTGDVGVTTGIGGFEFAPGGGWTNRASLSADQTDRFEFFASWPLEVNQAGARPWAVAPEYERRWTLQRVSDGASLADDLTQWGDSLGRDTAAMTAVPIVELFQEQEQLGYQALGGEELARTHDAAARIGFTRAFGSRPRDLYLPSRITAGVARTRRWEADSAADRRQWELGVTAAAINLFGEQGSRPRFSWYRSDEFENRVSLRLNEPVGSQPQWGVSVGQTTRLFGFETTEAEIDSSVEITGPASRTVTVGSGAILRWRTLGYPDLALFERLQEEPYYQHEEELTVQADFEEGSYRGSEVVARHRTSLVIGANGTISAYGDLGWLADTARYEEGTLHAVGIRLGLEGRLEY